MSTILNSIAPLVLIILAGLPWGPVGVAVGHSVADLRQLIGAYADEITWTSGGASPMLDAMSSRLNQLTDMIGNLTLYMNKVRQAAITREIIEVVSGAQAAAE